MGKDDIRAMNFLGRCTMCGLYLDIGCSHHPQKPPVSPGPVLSDLLSVEQQARAIEIFRHLSRELGREKDDGVTYRGTLAELESMVDDFLFEVTDR